MKNSTHTAGLHDNGAFMTLGCVMMLIPIGAFVGAVAVIAVAVKWAISG
jgi:hypothetical protein